MATYAADMILRAQRMCGKLGITYAQQMICNSIDSIGILPTYTQVIRNTTFVGMYIYWVSMYGCSIRFVYISYTFRICFWFIIALRIMHVSMFDHNSNKRVHIMYIYVYIVYSYPQMYTCIWFNIKWNGKINVCNVTIIRV